MSNQNDNPSFLYKLWVIISYHSKKKIKTAISNCRAKREARRTSGKSISLKKIAIISGIILASLTVLAAGGAIATHIWLSRNYYDNSRAVAMLNANARSHSKGLCAMYVRSALEGGGVPTFGFPGNACEYFDFLPRLDFKEVATHKSKKYEPKAGDIMVGGANFGCGSSREHAPISIRACGVRCVIAASFARIFYRNAINIGLAILECPAASEGIDAGDEVSVDFDTGIITNVTKNETYQAEPFPEFIKDIIRADGLMNSIKGR